MQTLRKFQRYLWKEGKIWTFKIIKGGQSHEVEHIGGKEFLCCLVWRPVY